MPDPILLFPRKVSAKGARRGTVPNKDALSSFLFEDELKAISNIQEFPYFNESIHLLYPGSGSDVLTPLLVMEKLFPQTQTINLTFVDLYNGLPMIKTILDDVGIPFSEKEKTILFYWDSIEVSLTFVVDNIFRSIQGHSFNFYFERRFAIMKEKDENYEHNVVNALSKGGFIFSDFGFSDFSLESIKVPPKLSPYNEMIFARKTS